MELQMALLSPREFENLLFHLIVVEMYNHCLGGAASDPARVEGAVCAFNRQGVRYLPRSKQSHEEGQHEVSWSSLLSALRDPNDSEIHPACVVFKVICLRPQE